MSSDANALLVLRETINEKTQALEVIKKDIKKLSQVNMRTQNPDGESEAKGLREEYNKLLTEIKGLETQQERLENVIKAKSNQYKIKRK
jgi:seryl-tRNA synthetase